MAGGGVPPSVSIVGASMSKKDRWTGLLLVTTLFFLWGFAYGLLDVLNKHFQNVLGITKLQSTGLQVAYFGSYFFFPPLVGGPVLRKWGYKVGIMLGLGLYVSGALLFWPAAKFLSFGAFVGATFVMACGLSELETAANPYISVLGDPKTASFRLNFSQSFNGVGSFVGPLIASHAFFSNGNQNNLTSVQFVYLGIAISVGLIAIGFAFVHVPEISDDLMMEQAIASGDAEIASRPLHKQWHTIFGFIAQFVYVASQVTLASFFLNYVTEVDKNITDALGSNLLSVALATFTVGRFISTGLMKFFNPRHILAVYAFMCALLCGLTIGLTGIPAVVVLIAIFFFESCMYPTIFTLAIKDLGKNTKKGSSMLIMGVGGGAVFPPIQGAIADAIGTPKSQLVPMIGYCFVFVYALFLAEPFGKKKIHAQLQDVESVDEKVRSVEVVEVKA
jgi:MFS transporter, FHS family, L-fucose permease